MNYQSWTEGNISAKARNSRITSSAFVGADAFLEVVDFNYFTSICFASLVTAVSVFFLENLIYSIQYFCNFFCVCVRALVCKYRTNGLKNIDHLGA